MSTETKDAIIAAAERTATALKNIRQDIKDLAGSVNPDGLTAAEALTVKSRLEEIAGDAEELDSENPATTTAPETQA